MILLQISPIEPAGEISRQHIGEKERAAGQRIGQHGNPRLQIGARGDDHVGTGRAGQAKAELAAAVGTKASIGGDDEERGGYPISFWS